MRSKKMLGTIMLLTAAFAWGCSFTAQAVGMEYVGPYTLQAVRMLLGSAVLAPLAMFIASRRKKAGHVATPQQKKRALLGGVCCGIILTVAANLQQIGIDVMQKAGQANVAGKAAFITAMYVLIVPLVSVLMGKKIGRRTIIAVIMGAVGLYLLCIQGSGLTLGVGDPLIMLCALGFAAHILVIDYFADVEGVLLSCLQFLVAGVISAVIMFAVEQPTWKAVLDCWVPIVYMAVMSCGVAYTLQIVGQKYVAPTAASLLMSMESVFSVLCGMVVLHQIPTMREAWGCIIMMAAILLCQLPSRKKD